MMWENEIGKSKSASFMLALLLIFFTSCHQNVRTDTDTVNSGTIHISVDESFKPVIDSQIQVFEALHPKAKIIAEYKPEAECFKDLIKDSTRMIIVTRGLSPQEEKYYKDSISVSPTWAKIAYDAIAVVVNINSPDSIFHKGELKSILDGSAASNKTIVFDGLKETSTIRYVVDSIMR